MKNLVFHWFLCCNLTFFYISIFNVWLRYDKWHCELPSNYIFFFIFLLILSQEFVKNKTSTYVWSTPLQNRYVLFNNNTQYYVLNNILRFCSDIHRIHILSSTTWLGSLYYNHQEFYKKWYLDHVLKSYLQQVSDFMRNG